MTVETLTPEVKSEVQSMIDQALQQERKKTQAHSQKQNGRFLAIDNKFVVLQQEIKDLMQAVKFQGQEIKHLRELMEQRFEDMNKRFSSLQWIIGIGFGLISTLQVVLIAFLLNAKL